jgi:hypothetical protein
MKIYILLVTFLQLSFYVSQAADCQSNKIVKNITTEFIGEIEEYFYKKNSTHIFIRDAGKQVFWSKDDGATFQKINKLKRVAKLYLHAYEPNRIYALSEDKEAFYSEDGGENFESLSFPTVPNFLGGPVLLFNGGDPDHVLFRGILCSQDYHHCETRIYYTINHGTSWISLSERSPESCSWVLSEGFLKGTINSMLCMEKYPGTMSNQETFRLVRSDDLFKHGTTRVVLDRVSIFRTFRNYVLAAVEESHTNTLALYVSLDGERFTKTQFPSDMIMRPRAFTILESTTSSLFVTNALDGPFGHMYASDSSGVRFSTLLKYINQDTRRTTDYERVQGLEGIIIINRVKNPLDTIFGLEKELETLITFNDGGTWTYLKAPEYDISGTRYNCGDEVIFSSYFLL